MRSIRTHSATEAAGATIAVRLGKLSGSSRLGCTCYAHSMGTWIKLANYNYLASARALSSVRVVPKEISANTLTTGEFVAQCRCDYRLPQVGCTDPQLTSLWLLWLALQRGIAK